MNTPLLELIRLGILHLSEVPDPSRRAQMLDAAASVFSVSGDAATTDTAAHISGTAALIREAEDAQLRLFQSFRPSTDSQASP